MLPSDFKPTYLKAQDEVTRLMSANGFERAGNVNFLIEHFDTDWGDAALYVNWEQKILVAYRFGNPMKVLYGREPRKEFMEKVADIDARYGANGRWIISHANKELAVAVTSYFMNKEKEERKKECPG